MTRIKMTWGKIAGLAVGGLMLASSAVVREAWGGPADSNAQADSAPIFDTLPAPTQPSTPRHAANRKAKAHASQRAMTSASASSSRSEKKPLPPATPIDRNKPLDQYLRVDTSVDMGLVCFAHSGADPTDADYKNFAIMLSDEYPMADTFAKQKLLDSLKSQMQERLRAFKANPYIAISQNFYLEHYNIPKHAFPVVSTQGIPVSWLMEGRLPYFARTTSYILRLTNARDFAQYAVADEGRAQDLESRQPVDRSGEGIAYLFVRDTEPGSHTIRAEIVKARLYDKGKDLIAELGGAGS